MTLALDNTLVRIISVSGGRILVDFNNPLSGKDIIYEFSIKKIVEDIKEKTESLIDFFFKGQKIDFEIKDKSIILKTYLEYKPIIDELNKEFKNILNYELVLKSPDKEIKNGKDKVES